MSPRLFLRRDPNLLPQAEAFDRNIAEVLEASRNISSGAQYVVPTNLFKRRVNLCLPSIVMRPEALPKELGPLFLGRFPDVVDLIEAQVAILE